MSKLDHPVPSQKGVCLLPSVQVSLQTLGSSLYLCFFGRAGVLPPWFTYAFSVSGLLTSLASLAQSVMKAVPVKIFLPSQLKLGKRSVETSHYVFEPPWCQHMLNYVELCNE